MGKAYSKEIRDAVVKARMSGMLVKDICRKFHVCDQTIRDWMKADANVVGRTSIKKPPIKVSPHVQSSRENGRFSDEDRREVVKLYHEGYSVADICKSVQIGRSTLYRWISLHTEFRRYGGEVFTSKDVEVKNTLFRSRRLWLMRYDRFQLSQKTPKNRRSASDFDFFRTLCFRRCEPTQSWT